MSTKSRRIEPSPFGDDNNESLLREAFVVIAVTIPQDCIWTPPSLPEHWQAEPAGDPGRTFGDHWIRQGTSAVLAVPSIIIPAETNYLLNPRHPNFRGYRLARLRG